MDLLSRSLLCSSMQPLCNLFLLYALFNSWNKAIFSQTIGGIILLAIIRLFYALLFFGVFIAYLLMWSLNPLLPCLLFSDTFNENSPPTNDPTYISLLGASAYKAMSKGDKDAVWLMQVSSWSYQPTLPPKRLIGNFVGECYVIYFVMFSHLLNWCSNLKNFIVQMM